MSSQAFAQGSICSFGCISSSAGRCHKNIGAEGYNIQSLLQRLTIETATFFIGSANLDGPMPTGWCDLPAGLKLSLLFGLFCLFNSESKPGAISSFFCSFLARTAILRCLLFAMPGFHVTVGYLPYSYRPEAIGPGYVQMISARAAALGQPIPSVINGSMVLCSTSSQQPQDYQVIIRESKWNVPWHDWGTEVAMAGPLAYSSSWMPDRLPPLHDRLFWDAHDIRDLVRLVAGLFGVPCKLHYYYKNYDNTVDCYIHYKDQMSRKSCFEHYTVCDIYDPTFYNVARDYRYRGVVDHPEWVSPSTRSML